MSLCVLKCIFDRNEFDTTTAINGFEAFEIVSDSLKDQDRDFQTQYQETFDLIVLDLGMPISDGYESCRNIKKLYNQ